MILSDISIKRPVFASVITIILIIFGYVSFSKLSLREYPDIDPPVVSIDVTYPGASANVVESKITQLVEERVAGVEGIKFIESVSEDGRSRVTVEFSISRDIDGATNDIRDRVSSILDDLPNEADPPEIRKVNADDDVIVWFNLASPDMSIPELTDYARRYLVDKFSVLDGVARVRVGGGQDYAMRVWLDRAKLAARDLTVSDIENVLRSENVELPAGSVESSQRQFTVRLNRAFLTPKDFRALALKKGDDGYIVRLGDVARVELGTVENRRIFRGNGIPMVGIGIIKQSTANTITVATKAAEAVRQINPSLPEGMIIAQSYDSSVFIKEAISEVYKTLGTAVFLVVLVIYFFLRDPKAMLIPAITVPVSIISSFIVLYVLDYSINLLTLLGLVLAIGMVVDDAIVVLENISRRINELGEPKLLAAYRGAKEVGFAVIATTLVLVAVFTPLVFLEGNIGRLFTEFALTMVSAVCFSSFIALTLCAMLSSKILSPNIKSTDTKERKKDSFFSKAQSFYTNSIQFFISHPLFGITGVAISILASIITYNSLPTEYTPKEDRGAFYLLVNGPEGASFEYMEKFMDEIENRLMPYVKKGEIKRLLVRAPRSFGNTETYNNGIIICVLDSWEKRQNAFEMMDEIKKKVSDLSGVRAFTIMRQGIGGRVGKPVKFVLGGSTYAEISKWRDILAEKIEENNPGFVGLDWDYKETKPQIKIDINYSRAAELGVKVSSIGRTLEIMLGSRRVTTYIDSGEEYDVILEGERSSYSSPSDLKNIYVRSDTTSQLIPLSNLVTTQEFADSPSLNRYNRIRAITLEANLDDKLSLDDALAHLENLAADHLPETAIIDYKGQSREFKSTRTSVAFVFILGLVITYLVLAAQFESFIHPFIILVTIPTAVFGGLLGLAISGSSINIFSQIGLVMLIGLCAKNGILIVEFANQLREKGKEFNEAIIQASKTRLRPILMTGITTAAGSIPLILSSGAGSETRVTIGIVVLSGVLVSTFMTIYLVPATYILFARKTKPSNLTILELKKLEQEIPNLDK